MCVYVYIYIYIYVICTYIYIYDTYMYSSLQKWCNLGLAPLNPNYTTSAKSFDNRASPPNVSEPFL